MEHLESACDALRHVREWLRPGGHLPVEVPNVEAVCRWPRCRFHRAHLFNFTLATLEMAGRKARYSVVAGSVSSDGGNLTALFRKDETAAPVSGEIPGNDHRVTSIVRRHSTLRHLFSRHPYLRPLHKIMARLAERRAVTHEATPREILDHLLANESISGRRRSCSGHRRE